MNLKRILTTTGILAALSLSTTAIANPGGPGGPGGHLRHILRQLDLTEDQRAEIREIMDDAREDREAMREQHESLRERLRAELSRDTPDPEVLHDLVDERLALQAAAAHDRMDDLIAVHAVLTPEQRAELAELLAEGPEPRGPDARGPRGPDDGPRGRGRGRGGFPRGE